VRAKVGNNGELAKNIWYKWLHITKLFFTFVYLNRFSMAQKYYVFSGLGADERVFKNLSFGEYCPFRYIKNAQRVVGGGHSMVLSLGKI
jgi:hypothetical protein